MFSILRLDVRYLSPIRVLKSTWQMIIILDVTFWDKVMELWHMLWQCWLMILPLSTTSCFHVCSGRERLNWRVHFEEGFQMSNERRSPWIACMLITIFEAETFSGCCFLLSCQCPSPYSLVLVIRHVTCTAAWQPLSTASVHCSACGTISMNTALERLPVTLFTLGWTREIACVWNCYVYPVS